FYHATNRPELKYEITPNYNAFQAECETNTRKNLQSFLKGRYVNYSCHISRPLLCEREGSCISPYLSYEDISMRMIYEFTMLYYARVSNKRAQQNFISCLHGHCHFMQKYEDEFRMEFENIHRASEALVKSKNEAYFLTVKLE
ncbi:MAG: deoxyribodipyrimidine photolyase, partial [Burkholderiales bacterium]|nr:deoxyribodipyrimidine photolyase [Bacteroidia bacterium]